MFRQSLSDWVEFRQLESLVQVDFHWAGQETTGTYWENMEAVWSVTLMSLIDAQNAGKKYVLFKHGHSTSRLGKVTARSQVRKFMRSKEATPYIVRNKCIQHSSVFVAAIRPRATEDLC